MHLTRIAGLAAGLVLTGSAAQAQFATTVVDYSPGVLGAGELNDPNAALGGPVGGEFTQGSTDIVSLGEGGSLTLGFDVTITDGPGVDFTVFENAIVFGDVFAEVFFVEVSTDGTSFARFPTSYVGPQFPGDFTVMPYGTYDGFGGHQPVLANVFDTSTANPLDPARSGGESFDLAALGNDPLVLGGQVNLAEIHFVRLVDAPTGGLSTDSNGTPVFDSRESVGANSADFDAVAVIQHTGTVNANQPQVDLFLDGEGHLNLSLVDPNDDLDIMSFRGSFELLKANRFRLANLFTEFNDIPNGRVWRTPFPASGNLMGSLAISISDLEGNFSADQIFLQ